MFQITRPGTLIPVANVIPLTLDSKCSLMPKRRDGPCLLRERAMGL